MDLIISSYQVLVSNESVEVQTGREHCCGCSQSPSEGPRLHFSLLQHLCMHVHNSAYILFIEYTIMQTHQSLFCSVRARVVGYCIFGK